MQWLLLLDSRVHAFELVLHAHDLASRIFQLAAVHLCRGASQSPGGAVHNRCRHLQIA